MKLLVIEDDARMADLLRRGLTQEGWAVDVTANAVDARHAVASTPYDAVVCDVGLPGPDSGLDWCRWFRDEGHATPVLMLTARTGVEDRIVGLDWGADDYLGKPFAVSELLARMRALVRRQAGATTSVLTNDLLALDLARRSAFVEGAEVVLSKREFALLQALMLRPGAVLSRAQLESSIYGWGEEVESNAVDVIIHGLRRKLGADRIRNVRGLGWMVERNAVKAAGDEGAS